MALNNLDRFVPAARNPLAVGSLFERDRRGAAVLLQIFATSQYLSDLLIADPGELRPAANDRRAAGGSGRAGRRVGAEVAALADDDQAVMTALRRFKRRETLADLATATSSAASAGDRHAANFLSGRRDRRSAPFALPARSLVEKRGEPRRRRRQAGPVCRRWRWASWGASELNYSSDIDLIFLYDADGKTDGAALDRATSNFSSGWPATSCGC